MEIMVMGIGNITKAIWKMIWNKDMEYGYLKMDKNMMEISIMIWYMVSVLSMAKKILFKDNGIIMCWWGLLENYDNSIDII